MEPFKPTRTSTTTTLPRAQTERIYHQIEDSPRSLYDESQLAGPSRPPPPNSIRALLLTANRNGRTGSMRHMYTNRYGTQENIYEEISLEDRMRLLSGGHSMLSLNQSVSVEEEFRRVQNRHRRILGELNLSVEAMLMPSTPPNDSPVGEASRISQANTSTVTTNLDDDLDPAALVVGPTDELLSPVSAHTANIVGDMDSGFSGSSSSGGGASFVGSLRCRNGLFNTTRSSTPNEPCSSSISGSGGSCRSSQRSNEDPGPTSQASRSTTMYNGGGLPIGHFHTLRPKAAEDPGPNYKETKSKISFWSRKGWKKIPGFSSNTSVHKAGLNNGKCNSIFSCDV